MKKFLVGFLLLFLPLLFLSACIPYNQPNEEPTFVFNLSSEDEYCLSKYNGSDVTVTIPAVYNGKSVTSIGNSAFFLKDIKKVIIPEGVKIICDDAFFSCNSLEEICLPSTLNKVGGGAFYNCTSLSKVEYNGNIKEWCNIDYVSYDGFNCIEANPLFYGAELFINNKRVEHVIFDNTLSEVKPYVFCGYEYLKTVQLSSQNNIGEYSFYDCTALYSIKFPHEKATIEKKAFSNCSALVSIEVPSNILSIDETAFENCHTLIEVINHSNTVGNVFPDNSQAGWFPLNLHQGETIVENIDDFLFVERNYSEGYSIAYLFGYIGDETDISLPEDYKGKVYSVYQYSFYKNPFIESVNISNNIKDIWFCAFKECKNLKKVTFSPNSKLSRIISEAFANCTKLEEVVIPSYNIKIDSSAFVGTDSLVGATYDNAIYLSSKHNPYFVLLRAKNQDIEFCQINSNCKYIQDNAFYDCTSLKSVLFPEQLKKIGSKAFYNTGLTKVELPNIMEDIAHGAFSSCKNLTTVVFPQEIKEIFSYTFSCCDSLKTIYINNTLELICLDAFYKSPLEIIHFNGTIDEWLTLLENSENSTNNQSLQLKYTVYCSDGTYIHDDK